jgi:hypothetical protein
MGITHAYNCICRNNTSQFQVCPPGSPATAINMAELKLKKKDQICFINKLN